MNSKKFILPVAILTAGGFVLAGVAALALAFTEPEPEPEVEPIVVFTVDHESKPVEESYYTAPKEIEVPDQKWTEDLKAVSEIISKGEYIAKYNGICPEAQPDNMFTAEFKYLAAVGADSPYPTPEHFAETAWNDRMHGRGFNPWQVGNFVMLGLADNGENRRASLFIDMDAVTAYWDATWEEDRPYLEKVSTAYPTAWDELTARASARLQWLENTYRERCL